MLLLSGEQEVSAPPCPASPPAAMTTRASGKRVKYVWAVPSREVESLANVAPDKGKMIYSCEWR